MPPSEGCFPYRPSSILFIDELNMRDYLGSEAHENDIISQ